MVRNQILKDHIIRPRDWTPDENNVTMEAGKGFWLLGSRKKMHGNRTVNRTLTTTTTDVDFHEVPKE